MPILLGALLLAFGVMLLFGATEFDRGLLLLAAESSPQLKALGGIAAAASSVPVLLAALAAGGGALAVQRAWRSLGLLVIAAAGLIFFRVLTEASAGFRPNLTDNILPTQQPAFPDPAAAGGAAVWVALALLLTRHRPWRGLALFAAATLAMAAGLGRVVTGVAWPTDVIGGWAIGLAWTLLPLWLAGEDLGDGAPRPKNVRPQPETAG